MSYFKQRWKRRLYEIIKSEINSELVLFAVFKGDFDLRTAIEFVDELAGYEDKYPGHKLLADFSDVSSLKIDINDLMAITDYVDKNDRRSGKTAFVTGPRTGRYLVARLYVDMVRLFKPYEESAFQDVEKAVDWLCPQPA